MAKVILFGGGDGGGIRIGPNGIEPIPPWDPSLRLQLRALNDLVRASAMMPEKLSQRLLGGVIGKLTGSVLTQVEQIAGEIDADAGFVYQSDDGGFTCGSTGKPIPFPWPVDPRRTVERLLDAGVIEQDTIHFLETAARSKLDVFTVARDPEAAAKKLGIELRPEVARNLAKLDLSNDKVEDEVDRAVVEFYRKVVTDGRHVADWATNPAQVAERLKLKVSPEVIDRIIAVRDAGVSGRLGPGSVMCPAAVAVAVAIVVVLWTREFELPVRDRSGLRKL